MPAAKPKKAKDEPKSSLMISCGDTTLPVPALDSLTIEEVFAVLANTNNKAEVLWRVEINQPFGKATLTAWWWIARSRDAKVLLPLSVCAAEIDQNGLPTVGWAEAESPEA